MGRLRRRNRQRRRRRRQGEHPAFRTAALLLGDARDLDSQCWPCRRRRHGGFLPRQRAPRRLRLQHPRQRRRVSSSKLLCRWQSSSSPRRAAAAAMEAASPPETTKAAQETATAAATAGASSSASTCWQGERKIEKREEGRGQRFNTLFFSSFNLGLLISRLSRLSKKTKPHSLVAGVKARAAADPEFATKVRFFFLNEGETEKER